MSGDKSAGPEPEMTSPTPPKRAQAADLGRTAIDDVTLESEISTSPAAGRPRSLAGSTQLPFDQLDSRRFEILTYRLIKAENPTQHVRLMKGVAEQGRDVMVYSSGFPAQLIQCKNHRDPFTKPDLGRFLAEIAAYAMLETGPTKQPRLRIEVWCTGGFSDPAAEFVASFPRFTDVALVTEWIESRTKAIKALAAVDIAKAAQFFVTEFRDSVDVILTNAIDISGRLRAYPRLEAEFFETKFVIEESRVPALVRTELEPLRTALQVQSGNGPKLDEILGFLSKMAAEPRGVTSPTDAGIHQEIDAAAQPLKDNQPTLARDRLERLLKVRADALTARARFRIHANLGHCCDQEGKHEAAGRLYLQAHAFQPDEEDATFLQILGFIFLDQIDRAHDVAAAARKRFPTSARIAASWANTAPASMALEALIEQIDPSLRSEIHVRFVLARRALMVRRFDEAEQFLRSGPDSQEPNPLLQETLGSLLLARRIQPLTRGLHARPPGDTSDLAEAERLLATAVNVYAKRGARSAEARARLALSQVLELVGRRLDSDVEIQLAKRADPASVEVRIATAVLAFSKDDVGGAIEVLRGCLSSLSNVEGDAPERVEALFAQLLRARKGPGDLEEAAERLSAVVRSDKVEPEQREEFVEELLACLAALGRPQSLESLLKQLPEASLSVAFAKLIRVLLMLDLGQREAAREAALELHGSCELLSWRARHRLALILTDLKEHKLALGIWEAVVPQGHLGADTFRLLECAALAEEFAILRDRCRSLRGQWGAVRRLVELELHALEELGDVEGAIALTSELLGGKPTEADRRWLGLRRAHLWLRQGKTELISSNPDDYPAVEAADPQQGMLTTACLVYAKNGPAAVRYAYRFVRRCFGSPEAHIAMLFALGPWQETRSPVADFPSVVASGCAVELAEEGQPARWVVLEDEPDPSLERNEFAPTHPYVQRLIGLKTGDRVELNEHGLQRREARIGRITSKYVRRWNDCLSGWEERFPSYEPFVVGSIRFQKRPDGSLDLSPLMRALDERTRTIERCEQTYSRDRSSVYIFAKAIGTGVPDAIAHLASRRELRFYVRDGSRPELDRARGELDGAKTVVVAPCALSTLLLLDEVQVLETLPFQLVVSSTTLIRFRQHLDGMEKRAGMHLVKEGERLLRVAETQEALEAKRSRLHALCDRLERFARQAHGGSGDLGWLPRKERKEVRQWYGRSWIDTLSLTFRDPGTVLWADDMFTGQVCLANGRGRFWSALLFDRLLAENRMSQERVVAATLRFVQYGFDFLGPSAPAIVRAVDLANWELRRSPLSDVLTWLGNPRTAGPALRSLLIETLVFLWRERREASAVMLRQVTFAVLDAVRGRVDLPRLVTGISNAVASAFRLDPIQQERVREAIVDWERGIIVGSGLRSGLLYLPRP